MLSYQLMKSLYHILRLTMEQKHSLSDLFSTRSLIFFNGNSAFLLKRCASSISIT